MAREHQIHLVTDRKRSPRDLREAVTLALRGGVNVVQLREKGGPALALYEDALALIPESRRFGAKVFTNDRLDVALAAGADGVHLAGKSLPVGAARKVLPPDTLLGVSVHGLEEARLAALAGADYVTFGHVYPTASKPGLAPRGVRQLARIVASVNVPVLAIGGVDEDNLPEVLSTGAAGVAVISSVLAAEDPEGAARRLRLAADEFEQRPKVLFPGAKGESRAHQRQP